MGLFNKRADMSCEQNLQDVLRHEWSSPQGKSALKGKIRVSAGDDSNVKIRGWPAACAELARVVDDPSRSDDLRLWEDDLRRVEKHLCLPPKYEGTPESLAARGAFLESLPNRILKYCLRPRYGHRLAANATSSTIFKREYLPQSFARDVDGEQEYTIRNEPGQGFGLGRVAPGDVAAAASQGDHGAGAAADESLRGTLADCAIVASACIGDALQLMENLNLAEMGSDSQSETDSDDAEAELQAFSTQLQGQVSQKNAMNKLVQDALA
jgi:hypothetical protein